MPEAMSKVPPFVPRLMAREVDLKVVPVIRNAPPSKYSGLVTADPRPSTAPKDLSEETSASAAVENRATLVAVFSEQDRIAIRMNDLKAIAEKGSGSSIGLAIGSEIVGIRTAGGVVELHGRAVIAAADLTRDIAGSDRRTAGSAADIQNAPLPSLADARMMEPPPDSTTRPPFWTANAPAPSGLSLLK